MKVVIVALALAVMFLGGVASADDTGSSWWHSHSYDNDYVDRYSEIYKKQTELGAMAEVTLYEDTLLNIPYALGTQGQYDFNNQEWGFYGKVSLNLSPTIKKLFGQE